MSCEDITFISGSTAANFRELLSREVLIGSPNFNANGLKKLIQFLSSRELKIMCHNFVPYRRTHMLARLTLFSLGDEPVVALTQISHNPLDSTCIRLFSGVRDVN